MNFFAVLPPELVLAIALRLDLGAVACCLLVCQQWYDVLSSLEPYWRQACVKLGLSESLVRELVAKYGGIKCVAFAAHRHRQIIVNSHDFSDKVTEGYPYNLHYVCNYASGDTLVGTVYKDFKPCGIVVNAIDRSAVLKSVIDPKFAMRAENRTYWARVVSNLLVLVTASGLWSIYDLTRNGALLAQWRGDAIYDSEVKITICKWCHCICTTKLVSGHCQPTYWDVRVVSPNLAVNADTVLNTKPVIVRFKVDGEMQCGVKQTLSCKKSIHLFSQATKKNARGVCMEHSLLLQCGSTVYNYKLYGEDEESTCNKMISYSPSSNFTAQVDTDPVLCKNSGLSTEMVLSSNQELLGMVFQSQLIVWERKTSQLLSVAEIELDSYIHEQIHLVALGQMYSLIGLEFSSTLLIVLTSTGQVVREFTDFAGRHIPLVGPYIEFLTPIQDSWLSDLSQTPISNLPTVVYWNKTNRTVEGVFFGRESEERTSNEIVPTRRKAWWKLW